MSRATATPGERCLARWMGMSCAAALFACAICLMTAALPALAHASAVTVTMPLVQAGDTSAFQVTGASQGGAGLRMKAKSAKNSSAASLDAKTRTELKKRFEQAAKSMRTVKSARRSSISSLKLKASAKNDRAIARLFGRVVNFHPEYFYVSNMVKLTKSSKGRYVAFELGYAYKFGTLKKRLKACEKGLADLLSWVPANGTELEKVKAVHDWLVRNCTYDANVGYEADLWSPYNVYGALVNRKPVCQGYSLAFLLAMQQLGIKATCVGQYIGNQGHMWNRVRVDGSWYHVDLTYDDPLTNVTLPSYSDRGFYATPSTTYFMKSDSWWRSHAAQDGWHRSWFPQGPAGTDTRYDKTRKWATYQGAAPQPSKPVRTIVDLDRVANGTTLDLGSGSSRATFKVTGASTVSYHRCRVAAKNRDATVPSTVNIAGRKFSVTGISRGAFRSSGKVRTLRVKTTKLTQKGVAGSLSGSKVKNVKAPLSMRSPYRQYFAKANSGRSVKVS